MPMMPLSSYDGDAIGGYSIIFIVFGPSDCCLHLAAGGTEVGQWEHRVQLLVHIPMCRKIHHWTSEQFIFLSLLLNLQ